ncbi:MAG: carboxypeptidase regulatory-like domain-containing protein [Candidatus Riflebacteria bacterium]|nr:carboxypeptidase regulatory-like domain-containing protein [Candidatus Riflebacteria bacterium]
MRTSLIVLLVFVSFLLILPGCRQVGDWTPEISGDDGTVPIAPIGKKIDGLISSHLLETVDVENLIDRSDPTFQIPGENVSEDAPLAKVLDASSKRKLLILNLNYLAVLRDLKGRILESCVIDANDGTFVFKKFLSSTIDLKVEIMLKKEYQKLIALSNQDQEAAQKVSLLTFVQKTAIVTDTGSSSSSISQASQERVIIDAESIAIAKIFQAGQIEALKSGKNFTIDDAKKSSDKIQTVVDSLNQVLNTSNSDMNTALSFVLEFRGQKLSDIAISIMTFPKIDNVTASSVSEKSAVISWTTDQPTSSQVDYGLSSSYSNSSTFDSSLKTNHSVFLSGLISSATYHYRVKGRTDPASQTTEVVSADSIFLTPSSVDRTPPVISNFKIELVGLDTLKLSWTTDKPTLGVVQYGPTTKYGFVTDQKAVLAQYQEFEVTGFVPGTTYHFLALAVDSSGNEAKTVDATFTLPDPPAPEIVDLKVIPSTSTAQISWVTEKKCQRKIEYGLTKIYGTLQDYTNTKVSYHTMNLSNLSSGQRYFFKVTVKDDKGKEGYFEGSFLTLVQGAPQITNLVYSQPLNGKINFSWATDQQAKSYIEYGTTFDYGAKSTVTSSFAVNHSLTVENLENAQTYHFRAVSTNSTGQTGYSSDIIIQIPDTTKPIISNISTGKIGTASVKISWNTDKSTIGRVSYGQDSTLGLFTFYSTEYSQDHQATIDGLEAGKSYFFKIMAKDRIENETDSDIGTFSTQIEQKFFPPEIQIIATSSNIQDFWLPSVYEGGQLPLKVLATDTNPGVTLTYLWSSANGTFSDPTASQTVWTAPFGITTGECFCKVTDSRGFSSTTSVQITIIPFVKTGSGKIFGKLVDIVTGQPIAGAVVGLSNTNYKTVSATDGTFEIDNVDPGNYTVVIMRDGYLYKSIPNVVITKD